MKKRNRIDDVLHLKNFEEKKKRNGCLEGDIEEGQMPRPVSAMHPLRELASWKREQCQSIEGGHAHFRQPEPPTNHRMLRWTNGGGDARHWSPLICTSFYLVSLSSAPLTSPTTPCLLLPPSFCISSFSFTFTLPISFFPFRFFQPISDFQLPNGVFSSIFFFLFDILLLRKERRNR